MNASMHGLNHAYVVNSFSLEGYYTGYNGKSDAGLELGVTVATSNHKNGIRLTGEYSLTDYIFRKATINYIRIFDIRASMKNLNKLF